MPIEASYEFDEYRFDPVHFVLFGGGEPIHLRPQTCELLRVFVSHPQEVLTLDFLKHQVWYGVNTNDSPVFVEICTLREILGDDANKPKFIETLKKRGFRFLPKVRPNLPRTKARELYEKARHYYHKSTPNDVRTAITNYEQVISLNQEYLADAYAGVAESYVLLGTFGHQDRPAADAMTKAREAALKALTLDEGVAEAHNALASVASLYDWQWEAAVRHYDDALRLKSNPVLPTIRAWYALCLAARGDGAEARLEISRARADFPSSFLLAGLSGRIAYIARDFDTALKECDESISLEEHFLSHQFRGHVLRVRRDYEAASTSFQQACQLSGNNPVCLADLAHIRGLQGRNDEAMAILRGLEQTATTRYVSPHVFALIYLGLREMDRAFEYLEKTFDERGAYLIFLTTDPIYDPVRHDPRFTDLVNRVGFAYGTVSKGIKNPDLMVP